VTTPTVKRVRSDGGFSSSQMRFLASLAGQPLVESREAIMPRPSLLDLDVPLSVHPAPDILSLRFCSCEVQIDRVRIFRRFYPCCSYAHNRDKIHVLLLDSFCPNYRGFHLHDVDVPFLHL
jgi:hypothetical protein